MNDSQRKHWRRFEAERGYIRAKLRLGASSETGMSALRSGYRAQWHLGDPAERFPIINEAPITVEGDYLLGPSDEAFVRLHPTFPEFWEDIRPGSEIALVDVEGRVGTAVVVELVPAIRRVSGRRDEAVRHAFALLVMAAFGGALLIARPYDGGWLRAFGGLFLAFFAGSFVLHAGQSWAQYAHLPALKRVTTASGRGLRFAIFWALAFTVLAAVVIPVVLLLIWGWQTLEEIVVG